MDELQIATDRLIETLMSPRWDWLGAEFAIVASLFALVLLLPVLFPKER